MDQPPLQEPEGPLQCMGPDLTSVMGWDLLVKITRHMDTADRSRWRLVSKAACQAVHDSATALAPCSDMSASTAALLPQLLAKCSGLKQLSCKDLPRLSSIAGSLQLPLRLEALDISHTDVVDLSFIACCTSLRRLAAAVVPGCQGAESLQLAALLQQLLRLTALELRGNELRDSAARGVAAALQRLTGLAELDIGGTGQATAAALLPSLPHLTALRRLDLTYCFLAGQALHYLHPESAIPPLAPMRLQHLLLASNDLRAADALILAPALRRLTQLLELDLSGNSLHDKGMTALAPAIQQLTGLTTLTLADNGFGSAGAQALSPALKQLTRLQDLELCFNEFGPEGGALLAPAVQGLTGLLRLDLGYVDLRAEGMAALAPALQRLTLLRHLDLDYNALGPGGLQALLRGIDQLSSLHSLSLQYNALDKEDVLLFAASIHQLTGLGKLDLGARALLDAAFEQALADAIHGTAPGCEVSCMTCD